ncbi:hypothetical protein CEP53_012084 [Fusarium sp. AF-6]|nr:hypothetical protein CEP53_012084 [Fusarium sp. AF-6]
MDLRPSASTRSGNGEIPGQERKRNEEKKASRNGGRLPNRIQSPIVLAFSRWSAQSKTVTVCTVTSAVALLGR